MNSRGSVLEDMVSAGAVRFIYGNKLYLVKLAEGSARRFRVFDNAFSGCQGTKVVSQSD